MMRCSLQLILISIGDSMGSYGSKWMTRVAVESWFPVETTEQKRIRESRQHGPAKKRGKGKTKRYQGAVC